MSGKLLVLWGTTALAVIAVPWSVAYADRVIEEHHAADANGTVEVVNLAGSVEIVAWNLPEVEVKGTIGENIDRIEVTGSGNRTLVHVVPKTDGHRGGEARLSIHVPVGSALSATMVSADIKLGGIRGDVSVQTVSGDVTGDTAGDLKANLVSGSIKMVARTARRIEIRTISGDVQVQGGGGEYELTTVSGTVKADLASVSRGRFKTVSGDVVAKLSLVPDAELEGETVSGNIQFDFGSTPAAEFEVKTFSGDIHNCFGPAPAKAQYGRGLRLSFENGGRGHVRIDTKSGNVRLCTPGAKEKSAGNHPAKFLRREPADAFYVL